MEKSFSQSLFGITKRTIKGGNPYLKMLEKNQEEPSSKISMTSRALKMVPSYQRQDSTVFHSVDQFMTNADRITY